MNYNNVLTDFIIVQIGLPSDAYDESCDGVWVTSRFSLVSGSTIYNLYSWADSATYYPNSSYYKYANINFLGNLDASVQKIIKQVKIPYKYYNGSSVVSENIECKIFSPSAQEVGLNEVFTETYYYIQGSILQYFSNAQWYKFNNYLMCSESSSTTSLASRTGQALRTTRKNEQSKVYGYFNDVSISNESHLYINLRPFFILPKTITVDENNNLIV